jgi:ribosomal protein S18 acetylase RimI-like enzyme
MSSDVTSERIDQTQGLLAVDELVDVFLDVYADHDPAFFNEDRFRRQVTGHLTAPRWEAVTARHDGRLVGYMYGFALAPQTRWWEGMAGEVPEGFTAEDGHRTVAISELMVRSAWRRRGIARRLHDEFLAGRHEHRATLLVRPDNHPAKAAYASWGWRTVVQLQPGWEHAPVYDVLVREPVRP